MYMHMVWLNVCPIKNWIYAAQISVLRFSSRPPRHELSRFTSPRRGPVDPFPSDGGDGLPGALFVGAW